MMIAVKTWLKLICDADICHHVGYRYLHCEHERCEAIVATDVEAGGRVGQQQLDHLHLLMMMMVLMMRMMAMMRMIMMMMLRQVAGWASSSLTTSTFS